MRSFGHTRSHSSRAALVFRARQVATAGLTVLAMASACSSEVGNGELGPYDGPPPEAQSVETLNASSELPYLLRAYVGTKDLSSPQFCSVTLLSSRVGLTSRNCLYLNQDRETGNSRVWEVAAPTELLVVRKENGLLSESPAVQQVVLADETQRSSTSPGDGNSDMALLVFEEPIALSTYGKIATGNRDLNKLSGQQYSWDCTAEYLGPTNRQGYTSGDTRTCTNAQRRTTQKIGPTTPTYSMVPFVRGTFSRASGGDPIVLDGAIQGIVSQATFREGELDIAVEIYFRPQSRMEAVTKAFELAGQTLPAE